MTTIATNGRVMACDGRVTDAAERVVTDTCVKLTRLDDGRVFGFCGDTGDGVQFGNWLRDGCSGHICVGDGFHALVMHPDGGVAHFDNGLTAVRCDLPAAIGSGGTFAVGAMLAGAEPHEAVFMACKRDVWSGGTITAMVCEQARTPSGLPMPPPPQKGR